MNLTKAQLQSEFETKLQTLGTDENALVFETNKLTAIEKAYGRFITKVQETIEDEGLNVSDRINDLKIESSDSEVVITAPNYLVYQDLGVNGSIFKKYPDSPFSYTDKRPPIGVFINWAKSKNIQLRNNSTYGGKESQFKDLTEDEQLTKLGWAMSTKVFREGFKPRNIYSQHIPDLIEDLENEITGFVFQQIVQNIDIKPIANQIKK